MPFSSAPAVYAHANFSIAFFYEVRQILSAACLSRKHAFRLDDSDNDSEPPSPRKPPPAASDSKPDASSAAREEAQPDAAAPAAGDGVDMEDQVRELAACPG